MCRTTASTSVSSWRSCWKSTPIYSSWYVCCVCAVWPPHTPRCLRLTPPWCAALQVSDLLPGSAWAGVAAHLRTKIADFDRRIVALLDQRDAAHLEVRKAERRGLKDAAAEAQAEMSRLSRSIVELEKTRQLGLARLNELAGSLFPELALLDGVTLAEGSGAAIVERSFDDYENVGNYFR